MHTVFFISFAKNIYLALFSQLSATNCSVPLHTLIDGSVLPNFLVETVTVSMSMISDPYTHLKIYMFKSILSPTVLSGRYSWGDTTQINVLFCTPPLQMSGSAPVQNSFFWSS